MRITFVVPSLAFPAGGIMVLYEFANGLRRRGHDVHIAHIVGGPMISSLDEISWFGFESGIEHSLVSTPRDPDALPRADFIVNANRAGTDSEADWARTGLPLRAVQGYRVLHPDAENSTYRAPWPKICVARWLIDIGLGLGVPEEQLVHVPPGVDHQKYRRLTPLDQRPMQLGMLYHSHPVKGARFGLEAIAMVKRRIPELRSVLFGTFDLEHTLPTDTEYLRSPPQDVIVGEIYNRSRVFVCASEQEGFGLCSVEAMACGAALVTSATRGSDDFARHNDTAVVSAPADVEAMADNLETMLRDDVARMAIAERGATESMQFDWDASAGILEEFLDRYGADPGRYRGIAN